MRHGLGLVHLAVLGACLAAPATAVSGQRIHTVRPGESASSIAKRYYGEFELGGLLLKYNGKSGTVIQAGEKLRVPYCELHRVKRGDTWSALAQRYLERASVYPAVAALNGLSPQQPLKVGNRIVFPVVLSHRLERGDTLAVLAERFYGDTELSHVLQSFNRIDDPRRLSVGETLEIPLISLQMRKIGVSKARTVAATPVREKPARGQKKEATRHETESATGSPPARFKDELHAASEAFIDGDYDRARGLLEPLGDRVGSGGSDVDKAEYWRLLTFVYVAFDLPGETCAAYRSLAELSAGIRLDPDLVSPKIRDQLSRCRKRAELRHP